MSKHAVQPGVKKDKKSRRHYHRPGGGILSTEQEIAVALGEEPRTVRSWWHSRLIPGVVLGHRTVRFKLDDVLKALSKRTVPAVGTDRRNGQ